MSEVARILDQQPQELPREPDFMSLAAVLGFKEDEDGEALRQLCIQTAYRDETHYGEGILAYIRYCEGILYSSEVQGSVNRLEIRQGIWTALASLHYETGHFANCMRQLQELHADILHSNDLSQLREVQRLLQHVDAREMGKRATIEHMNTTQQEHVPDFTGAHFDVAPRV